jgi:diguanylate cyclase (GGDEF)-like protein
MATVRKHIEKSYDPGVVAVLDRRCADLEQEAWEAVKAIAAKNGHRQDSAQEGLGKLSSTLAESNGAANSIMDPIVSARHETQMLQGLACDLANALRVDDVAASFHKCLAQMIGYDTLAIYVTRGENLELISVMGENGHLFSKGALPMKESPSGWVAQNHAPLLNGNAQLEPWFSNDSKVIYRLQGALAVPFEGRGQVSGVVTLYHPDPRPFSRDDLRVAQSASLHIGRAVQSALQYQDATESAGTDHLTGVPNARALAIHIERELARASRDDSTVGVLVCDLDGFKQVNDRFGHLTGNEVLQRVAGGLRDTCRTSDYVARVGGDEFVLVLPALTEELCASQVKRLRRVALETGRAVCNEDCLSMSVGVAIYPIDGNDPKSLFAEADRRMYLAKQEQKQLSGMAHIPAPAPSALSVSSHIAP